MTQRRRNQVLQPCRLVDALRTNQHQHILVHILVVQPRRHHRQKPLVEHRPPQRLTTLFHRHIVRQQLYPVARRRVVRTQTTQPLPQRVHTANIVRPQHLTHVLTVQVLARHTRRLVRDAVHIHLRQLAPLTLVRAPHHLVRQHIVPQVLALVVPLPQVQQYIFILCHNSLYL